AFHVTGVQTCALPISTPNQFLRALLRLRSQTIPAEPSSKIPKHFPSLPSTPGPLQGEHHLQLRKVNAYQLLIRNRPSSQTRDGKFHRHRLRRSPEFSLHQ